MKLNQILPKFPQDCYSPKALPIFGSLYYYSDIMYLLGSIMMFQIIQGGLPEATFVRWIGMCWAAIVWNCMGNLRHIFEVVQISAIAIFFRLLAMFILKMSYCW